MLVKPKKLSTMKKLIRNTMVLVVMLVTHLGFAKDTNSNLLLTNHIKKGSHIAISNASGKIIFTENVNTNASISELFDFTQLRDGLYAVEITKGFEIKINTIAIKNHKLNVTTKKTIFKPVLRTKDTKVFISKLALADAKTMKIELYFEGDLFYSETVKGNTILNRVYQLDKRYAGDYKAIITANGRTYTEHFRI